MEPFEERSVENMVWFYREELERGDRGSRITHLIPKHVMRRLIHRGIIEYARGLEKRSGLVLSPKGREILDSYRPRGLGELEF